MSLDYIARLPSEDTAGEIRQRVLAKFYAEESEPTSLIEYRSAGSVLVVCAFRSVGDEAAALRMAARVAKAQDTTLVLTGVAGGEEFELQEQAAARSVRLETAETLSLSGYLGQYTAVAQRSGQAIDLAQRALGRPVFDLVLDASAQPLLTQELPPPGYFAVGDDASAFEAALAAMPELVGEFEKPRFVLYDASICAHGRSGKIGCTRCLDVCPTEALSHRPEAIEVDVNLCQGAGPCAAVCPSGAISYQYPPARDLLNALRDALLGYDETTAPCLLIHDAEQGNASVSAVAANLPGRVLPVQVEETGTVAAEFWLAALAWGAVAVRHLVPPQTPASVRQALSDELRWVQALLLGQGYSAACVELIETVSELNLPVSMSRSLAPARHKAFANKRNNLELAIDHLAEQGAGVERLALPAPSPFGEILVNRDKCTLCMACVSACPAGALLSGDESPKLRFAESNCLQCGLCRATCPESAIELSARWLAAPAQRREIRVLHEDAPLNCIVCGKPFGNKRMAETMRQRLGEHWMYQNPNAMRRLEMCEQCRVVDLYERDGGMDVYNKS